MFDNKTVNEDNHHMRVLQIPINVLELGGTMSYMHPVDKEIIPSPLRQCVAEGIGVLVNRPLNAIPPPGMPTGDWSRNSGGVVSNLQMER